jgi:hypothetical protein
MTENYYTYVTIPMRKNLFSKCFDLYWKIDKLIDTSKDYETSWFEPKRFMKKADLVQQNGKDWMRTVLTIRFSVVYASYWSIPEKQVCPPIWWKYWEFPMLSVFNDSNPLLNSQRFEI